MEGTVRLFKALGDTTRLRLLSLLLQGEQCVCDLMFALQLPQSTVSRHLAYLKNSGWVKDCRRGVWSYYRIVGSSRPAHSQLLEILKTHLSGMEEIQEDLERLNQRLQIRESDRCG